ncbi:hypothetical protein [Krasilnikovia sp. MM14-A1259]|uniref:hypothetical protein n=1 Tax=Krasilnikovia sp. MM14-A1259 TaxID=3373539 RepID=UPI0038217B23
MARQTKTKTKPSGARTGSPRVQAAFNGLKSCFKAYAVLSALALAGIAAMAATGHVINTFMWVRGVLLPLIAILLYRMSVNAARGSYKSFDRVRTVTLIMPIAIIGVDLIPGVCPRWYLAVQTVCMIPVIAAAVITRRPILRNALPKPR